MYNWCISKAAVLHVKWRMWWKRITLDTQRFLILFIPNLVVQPMAWFIFLEWERQQREKGGNILSLGLWPVLLPNWRRSLFTCIQKKCITAEQMAAFHMTKPINHLGGTQVWHSRAATHPISQSIRHTHTHGHRSMAPRGPERRPQTTFSTSHTSSRLTTS